jgi:hypothetical protein
VERQDELWMVNCKKLAESLYDIKQFLCRHLSTEIEEKRENLVRESMSLTALEPRVMDAPACSRQ